MEDKSKSSSSAVKQYESMIQTGLQTPIVRLLRESLEKSSCPVGNNFFRAVNCAGRATGGYIRGSGIVLCMNNIFGKYDPQDEVNQVLAHELIHALDDCRAANLDWNNCSHNACGEIRAYHLSGDLHFKRELLQGYTEIRGHGVECVKRRVLASLSGNHYCSDPAVAKKAMDSVWDICYNDTHPFDRAP